MRRHDDVIKWRHSLRYWPFVSGIHRSPADSPHKGQWRGAFMFFLSSEQMVEQTVDTPVIETPIALNMTALWRVISLEEYFDWDAEMTWFPGYSKYEYFTLFISTPMEYSVRNNILFLETNAYASPVPDVWSSLSACGYRHVLWLRDALNI